MNILVLTDAYTRPSFAPRLRFLCQYLTERGHAVDVYAEKGDPICFAHDYPIHEIPSGATHGIGWACQTVWNLLTDYKQRRFARRVLRSIRGQRFDLVLCTTFSTFPLGAALRVAQTLRLPLHADIRDLDEQVPGHAYHHHKQPYLKPFATWYSRVMHARRDSVVRAATAVTTVSPWHVEQLSRLNPNTYLIYNGFDPRQFYPKDIAAGTFLISYIGRLYTFQTLALIRECVRELNLPDMQLNLHTPEHNYLPIDSIGNEIRRSSVMLVLTNPSAHGMMTTKFFEALGCEKPVLCIPNDRGLLAHTIERHNAGLASGDKEDIKRFLMTKYSEWKQNGFTRQQVQEKDLFNRQYQAKQFEDLFRHIARL